MKKSLILGTFIVALAVLCYGQTAADHIKAGDEAYARFDDQQALEHYQEALKLEPQNYEALWKVSRADVDIADVITGTGKDAKQRRMKLYTDGTTYGLKAVAVNSNDTWGHFQIAAALGKKLLMLGKKEQIDGSKQIKAEIDKAIALDPNNDLAYHALGRWHRRIAEIGGAERFFGSILFGSIPKGTFAESEKYLKKAVDLKPDYVNHHLELGLTYVSLKKYDQAAQEFQKAIDLPKTTSKDDVLKAQAQAEQAKLKRTGK
jgi:tetratricopeptide (TPR) repeat protein